MRIDRRPPLHSALTAILAVAALLGQAALPHVHTWQVGRHADGAALDVLGAPTVAPADDGAAGDHHDRASCPVCQALAQSRQLAAAPRTVTLAPIALLVALPTGATVAPALAAAGGPAAPRAPPTLA